MGFVFAPAVGEAIGEAIVDKPHHLGNSLLNCMQIRRQINSLIQRSNYQIVKTYDAKAAAPLPPDILLNDEFLRLRIAPRRKHAWLIAAPKSGSTWLSALLETLLGWKKHWLYAGLSRREQDPDVRLLLRYPNDHLFSPQQHCRASEPTVEFINRFRIKPIIQTRNIYDAIISLREHFVSEGFLFPMAYADREFLQYSEEKQFQFLIDMVLPWYFNFYASWFQVEGLSPDNLLFVNYDDLLRDPGATLGKILEYLGETRSPAEIENALEKARGMDTRKNKAVTGRGNCLLSEGQKARIREMRQFYSHIDFSSIGL